MTMKPSKIKEVIPVVPWISDKFRAYVLQTKEKIATVPDAEDTRCKSHMASELMTGELPPTPTRPPGYK